ncbi:LOW QUALITY PROTEIN: L-fucose dehydrogenase [Pteropus medius]|uniref:LOW QUALITY PROTEIN: 17-beta-hydroxysteroid dehydrogenase 14 n=1 Tax=Pteropus vampyrus TaxID=132908 RepID=UPI00196AE4B8|nr:LOW QUALITY PROTEIN: 17-beta-hydroxysteroid dehydrogenase 14 [Pteropus giganteus]
MAKVWVAAGSRYAGKEVIVRGGWRGIGAGIVMLTSSSASLRPGVGIPSPSLPAELGGPALEQQLPGAVFLLCDVTQEKRLTSPWRLRFPRANVRGDTNIQSIIGTYYQRASYVPTSPGSDGPGVTDVRRMETFQAVTALPTENCPHILARPAIRKAFPLFLLCYLSSSFSSGCPFFFPSNLLPPNSFYLYWLPAPRPGSPRTPTPSLCAYFLFLSCPCLSFILSSLRPPPLDPPPQWREETSAQGFWQPLELNQLGTYTLAKVKAGASYSISLHLTFLTCKRGLIMLPGPQGCSENRMRFITIIMTIIIFTLITIITVITTIIATVGAAAVFLAWDSEATFCTGTELLVTLGAAELEYVCKARWGAPVEAPVIPS